MPVIEWDGSLAYVNVPIPTRHFFFCVGSQIHPAAKILWARQLKYEIKYKDIQIIVFEISLRN